MYCTEILGLRPSYRVSSSRVCSKRGEPGTMKTTACTSSWRSPTIASVFSDREYICDEVQSARFHLRAAIQLTMIANASTRAIPAVPIAV